MDELLGAFVAECRESLTALECELSRLARQPDDTDLLASVFRGVHTIKGTCGFLDLGRLHAIAHAIEDVLDGLRRGDLAANGPATTLLLEALGGIAAILDGLDRAGREPAGDDRPLIAALEALSTGSEHDDPRGAEVATAWPPGPARAGARAPRETDATMSAATTAGRRVVPPERLTAAAGAWGSARAPAREASAQGDAVAPASCLGRIEAIATALRGGVGETRVERIGTAFSQLPRLVRRLAIELDKPIELEMHGAEIEVDRRLIEPIKASLVHLVRNAADHGLEGRAERRRRGKREKGRIALDARHQADYVVVAVSDDGRGLDTEQITRAAVTSRFVGAAEAAAMTRADCQQLIFQPGFSTAEIVTPVSGRGVGLDAVRSGIEQLGGTIEVRSVPGRGAAFALQLPRPPARAMAGWVTVDDERRASPGSITVDAGLSEQRTKARIVKRSIASRRRPPGRPAAAARSDRKSVRPTPGF